jgi:TolA-binding protein
MIYYRFSYLACLVLVSSLSSCQSMTPSAQEESTVGQPSTDQSRVILGMEKQLQGMEKQLRERDRQIAILRSQLEALKFIDQDHAERKVRPPASLRATEHFSER